MKFTREERAMLALAALTYRGIVSRDEADLREKLVPWLPKLDDADLGRWECVWGPAAFRGPASVFHDAMVYVARALDGDRYAVAIRGTNPASIFDWIAGDLWVEQLQRWPYGESSEHPNPEISTSSFLGLRIIQSLRAGPEPPRGLRRLFRRILRGWPGHRRGAADALQHLRRALEDIDSFDPETRLLEFERNRPQPSSALSAAVRSIGGPEEIGEALEDHLSARLLEQLLGHVARKAGRDRGTRLIDFLRSAVAAAPSVEVNVTGHSKGGALANVVALWLADTQGEDAVDPWDPQRKATIHCYSFAGPTAGNTDFAGRHDAVLGERSHRIANALDVVPHAWEVGRLQQLSGVYEPEIATPEPLKDLVEKFASEVEEHRYSHVERERSFDRGVQASKGSFFGQAIHQHLDAYLDQASLPLNTTSLMLEP